MNPEPSSRHGWTQHDRAERTSKQKFCGSLRRTRLKSIGYALILSLVVLLDVFGNVPVVAAASHTAPQLPIPNASHTLQQFLKQGKPSQAKDAPLPLAGGKPTPPRGTSLPTKSTQPKPSVEPAKMKAVSQPLASFRQDI